MNKLTFKVVFVSPMTRTLMTTVSLFCNHPDKDQIKFVVLPLLREKLHWSSDLSADVFTVIERFKPDSPDSQGIVFDFSGMFAFNEPQLWQI